MHDSNGQKLLKLVNEACLLLNNGRIKNSYLVAITDAKNQHLTFAGSIYSTYFTLAYLSIDHYGQALIFDELS